MPLIERHFAVWCMLLYSFRSSKNPMTKRIASFAKVKTETPLGESPGATQPQPVSQPTECSSLCFPPRHGRPQGPSGVWNWGDHPDPALEVTVGQVRPLPPQLQPPLRPAGGGAASQGRHLLRAERPGARAGISHRAESGEGQAQEQGGAGEGVHRWGPPQPPRPAHAGSPTSRGRLPRGRQVEASKCRFERATYSPFPLVSWFSQVPLLGDQSWFSTFSS